MEEANYCNKCGGAKSYSKNEVYCSCSSTNPYNQKSTIISKKIEHIDVNNFRLVDKINEIIDKLNERL